MTHSFYKPGTSQTRFWNPYLESFDLSASMRFSGSHFLFDDEDEPDVAPLTDSAGLGAQPNASRPQTNKGRGWNTNIAYIYRESGRGPAFTKSSFLQVSLDFSLTKTTTVGYSQYYDIGRGITVRNEVNFRKSLHCWTGEFRWVPIGSGSGYQFRLFVTAIPAIKVDNSSTSNAGSFLNR